MNPSPYQLKSSKDVYQNPWLSVREDVVRGPEGKEKTFGVVTMKPGSTILALTDEKDVFLVREFKYGVDRVTLELPSGAIEEEESPLDAAKRELEEETGYRAERWIDAGIIDPFTTIVRSPNHLFIALGVQKTAQHLDDGESLEVERVPFDQAHDMVMRGEITHGGSCVLILKAKEILAREGIL